MLAIVGEPQGVGMLFWTSAAIGASAIDVVGNIPFMRMVKPRERVAMATVFSTWREMSALLSPLLAVIVLGLGLPFSIFFALLGLLSFGAAAGSTKLPRRI